MMKRKITHKSKEIKTIVQDIKDFFPDIFSYDPTAIGYSGMRFKDNNGVEVCEEDNQVFDMVLSFNNRKVAEV